MQKFKDIVSRLPVSKPLKQQLELLLSQYNDDDSNSLQMLIVQTHDLLTKNNFTLSKSKKSSETSKLMKSTSETAEELTNQELLNEVFDILLADEASDCYYSSEYEDIKENIRQIFNNMEKENQGLRKQINALEAHIGNIAMQLRNKLVQFIKPHLSFRAARDEYIPLLQTEERYQQLPNFIKENDANLSISDLVRQIKTLLHARVPKAHQETPVTEREIDMLLHDYKKQCDEYTKEAAETVVRFFKLLSKYLNEPLIVSLT
ncbi:unnamed protein product [Rotaria sp. Silwood2]|nr:unnamed protein product [Rotaria sp. Silwood2]CAF3070603.1 unnamed protein product [Rotaria sp. Silwood2]CAF3348222.1 unnamed protein product [Rotaria sp. Silwood2]CAF3513865.1 unnamed protein product [Rotaria sp. Silwood2]CAF4549903.1 unnamed protein product [Rotaria sp. Silwood2]